MTALIPITSRIIAGASIETVQARELHKFVESKREYSTWIKSRIKQYGFIEGEDYLTFLSNRSDGKSGRKRIDHHLTLDMAKELGMVERNEKGRQIRRYFIECEKQLKESTQIQTPDQAEATKLQTANFFMQVAQTRLAELKAIASETEVLNKKLRDICTNLHDPIKETRQQTAAYSHSDSTIRVDRFLEMQNQMRNEL